MSGLADCGDFYKDRVNLFLLLGMPARLDRCKHRLFSYLCLSNEMSPGIVQSPALFGPRMSKMTAPFNFEHLFLKLITDSEPDKCSELGMHNIGGHYQAGTSVRCITHFRQIYESKRFQYFDFGDADKN